MTARDARYNRLIIRVRELQTYGTKATEWMPVVNSTYRGTGVDMRELERRRNGVAAILWGLRSNRPDPESVQCADPSQMMLFAS